MKIVTIVGARPQFIKASTVSRAVAGMEGVSEILVHTGQHYDECMSGIFFTELGIPAPAYNLGIGGQSHGAMTGRQIEGIESVLLEERPDWVLVYGDTNSTLAGALAATKLNMRVAHVEAGLRSFNRSMPEEINRILTDHAADKLFAPTETAIRNLEREGISGDQLHNVGDVMFDSSLYFRDRARMPNWFKKLGLTAGEFVLATVHRAENTDKPVNLRGIFEGLSSSDIQVVIPVHPRTSAKLKEHSVPIGANIHVVDPVGYLEMVWLEANCSLIATDSGGVQKEAYFFRKPCVTLRNETEWVELMDTGWMYLAGADPVVIADKIATAKPLDEAPDIYGRGDAAIQIIKELIAGGAQCT